MNIVPIDLSTIPSEPTLILAALAETGLEVIVIGGIGAILHGDDGGTSDMDVTASTKPSDLAALVEFLRFLDAKLLVDLGDDQHGYVDEPIDEGWFVSFASVRTVTRYGVLDVVLRPDGKPRYEDWRATAIPMPYANGTVKVASLEDIIASKTAANRAKDHEDLGRLRRLASLIRRRQGV